MIDAYKDLLISNRDDTLLFYKNNAAIGAIFGIDTVNRDFLNLVAAAPIMYAHMDRMATIISRLNNSLEPVLEVMQTPEEKQLITNMLEALAMLRRTCLESMHVAEVGSVKAYSNKNKS